MKKGLILYLLLNSFFCFSQKITKENLKSGRIIYRVEKVLPPNFIEKVQHKIYENESTREMMMGTYMKTKPVNAFLEFKNNESYYVLSEKDLDDVNDFRDPGINMSATLAASRNQYFIDLSSDEKFYKAKNMSMEYELVYFEQPKWKLLKGSKKLLGYSCKKAVIENDKKKKTYAWYTENIPFGFGPKNFFGLPGLILEIEKGTDIFVAEKITINPEDIFIEKPKAQLKTTLKAKLKAFSNFMKEN